MHSAHESFLLAEAKARVVEGERRARLEQGLSELRAKSALRERVARWLVSLAQHLSPEVVASTTSDGCVQA